MTAPQRRLLDDCFLHDKDRLNHDDALALLAERLVPIAGVEDVDLADAHRRVAARAVVSPRNVPAFDNAAVDGYALAYGDLNAQGDSRLAVTQRIAAGDAAGARLEPGSCARIFTGAIIPPGADTVVMQEDVERDGDLAIIPHGARRGANLRRAGEDLAEGADVVAVGTRLRPQELAAVASLGIGSIACYARLKVALVSTGDEIIRPGTAIRSGQVYDSNHFLLRALLQTVDAEVRDLGVLPDHADVVSTALREAAKTCDVILTTGGASRGEEDHVVECIAREGTLHAWQLAVKPGRPLGFGRLGDAVFLGLPGNPVAAMVCFLFYAQPMFAHLQGARWQPPTRFMVPAGFSIEKKKPDRREFLRGWVEETGDGPQLRRFPQDGSGLISSLRAADGLIEIAEEVTEVAQGEPLGFIPFSNFGLNQKT
jgi:molybdopterin molybdotransferase